MGAVEGLGELRLRMDGGLVPPHTCDGGVGDKGHLESGEIDGLLPDMIAREGCDEVVNREAHDCGTEERDGVRERRRG